MALSRFGQLEAAIMERMWGYGRAVHVREVLEDLQQDRTIAYTTVMTVMDRLARKELVSQEKDGRAYRYRARAGRAAMTADLMRETLADFDAHDRRTALAAFVEDASAEDVAALRQALAELDAG